jgi:hypothetical protein
VTVCPSVAITFLVGNDNLGNLASFVHSHQTAASPSPVMSGTRSSTSPSPSKRRRRPSDANRSNGSPHHATTLPPLSLSILGVEPVDEFMKEVADFVHYTIHKRPRSEPNVKSRVEVEAKVGVLRDKSSGQRLALPVLVETSMPRCSSIVHATDTLTRARSSTQP